MNITQNFEVIDSQKLHERLYVRLTKLTQEPQGHYTVAFYDSGYLVECHHFEGEGSEMDALDFFLSIALPEEVAPFDPKGRKSYVPGKHFLDPGSSNPPEDIFELET